MRALAVEALGVRHGTVRAVDDLTFDVSSGTVVGLLGPNGCGKTSTLRAVAGLVRHSGRVTVNGAPGGSTAARRALAFVPDEPDGLEELSVAEYLALAGTLWNAGDAFRARAESLVRAFSLAPSSRVRLGALSHGQRRVASLVAALALARPLLVVDEATAALDPEACSLLREALRAAAGAGSGVLVATQDLAFAERVCDRVVLLAAGRLLAAGETAAVAGGHSLEEAFLEATGARRRIREAQRGLCAR